MSYATSHGPQIYFETFGAGTDPVMLLVMGLGAQAITWDSRFCAKLAAEGFQVVRFDNRDVGLSEKTQAPLPVFTAPTAVGGVLGSLGLADEPPYRLSDMALDAIGVLDAVGAEKAHVVGASLGGMIAQTMAIEHPDRVASLVSIMSTTGDPAVGQPTPEAATWLLTPSPSEREAAIEHGVNASRAISGPLFDEERSRAFGAERYDRCFNPAGSAFQLAAVIADGDRTQRLGSVRCPTLVIHGKVDPLIGVSGGYATTAAIPGATELVLEEMGHDLPQELWGEIIEAIVENARR